MSSTLAAESKSYAKRSKDLHTQVCISSLFVKVDST
jgi:hypothetical protein